MAAPGLGELISMGARWAAKRMMTWLSAGFVGYEVAETVNGNENSIKYVNNTTIKSVNEDKTSPMVMVLLVTCLCVVVFLLAVLGKILYEMRKFNKNQKKEEAIEMRELKKSEGIHLEA